MSDNLHRSNTFSMHMYERRDAIMGFKGKYSWLSNSAPSTVTVEGVEFRTVEHGLVASMLEPGKSMAYDCFVKAVEDSGLKAKHMPTADLPPAKFNPEKGRNLIDYLPKPTTCSDTGHQVVSYPDLLKFISNIHDPGRAKWFGNFLDQRPDWEKGERLRATEHLIQQKFSIPELRDKLLATKARPIINLIEKGDASLGLIRDCDRDFDPDAPDARTMSGTDVMGKIIHYERDSLKRAHSRGMVRAKITVDTSRSDATLDQVRSALVHCFGEISGEVVAVGPIMVLKLYDEVPNGDICNVLHPRAHDILSELNCSFAWTSEGGKKIPPVGVAYDPKTMTKPRFFFHDGVDDENMGILMPQGMSGFDLDELKAAQEVMRSARLAEQHLFEKHNLKWEIHATMLSELAPNTPVSDDLEVDEWADTEMSL